MSTHNEYSRQGVDVDGNVDVNGDGNVDVNGDGMIVKMCGLEDLTLYLCNAYHIQQISPITIVTNNKEFALMNLKRPSFDLGVRDINRLNTIKWVKTLLEVWVRFEYNIIEMSRHSTKRYVYLIDGEKIISGSTLKSIFKRYTGSESYNSQGLHANDELYRVIIFNINEYLYGPIKGYDYISLVPRDHRIVEAINVMHHSLRSQGGLRRMREISGTLFRTLMDINDM